MKIIDISRPLQTAPVYPDSDTPKVTKISDLSNGDLYNISMISADSHAATHADAYSHYLDNGLSIDKMPLEKYYGKCTVVTLPSDTLITKKILSDKVFEGMRIVLKTGGNSYLSKDGAEYLAEFKIKTIVTDALSIAPIDNETEIHTIILSADIAVVENVILENVPDGQYILSAFPIKIEGCDGAPVRAVLIDE